MREPHACLILRGQVKTWLIWVIMNKHSLDLHPSLRPNLQHDFVAKLFGGELGVRAVFEHIADTVGSVTAVVRVTAVHG